MRTSACRGILRTTLSAAAILACGALPLFDGAWLDVLAQTYLEREAQDPNSASVGRAIEVTCRTGANGMSPNPVNNQFQDDCNALVGGSVNNAGGGKVAGISDALSSIAIRQVSAQNAAAAQAAQTGGAVLITRLIALRAASEYPVYAMGAERNPLQFSFQNTGGGASGDYQFGDIGVFVNGQYTTGDEDRTEFQAGYDFDYYGLTVGADYRFADNLVAGLAVGYEDGDVDYDRNAGDLDVEDVNGHLFGSYYHESGVYVDVLMGYGRSDYELDRNIIYALTDLNTGAQNTARQSAESDTDADRYEFSAGGGYNLVRGPWTLTPTARVDYLYSDIDKIEEKTGNALDNGGGFAMEIDSYGYESLTTNLGGQVSYAVSQSWGVLVPQFSAEWVHEFEDDQEELNAVFKGDVNRTPFIIKTRRPDTDYFNLGVGASAQFAGGKSAFLSFETILGYEDLDLYTIQGGFRMEF